MAELLQEENWTDEHCQAFLDDYQTRRIAYIGHGTEYTDFMQDSAGTFPREVVEFMEKNGMRVPLPAGELARVFPSSKPWLPGVEVVSTESQNR